MYAYMIVCDLGEGLTKVIKLNDSVGKDLEVLCNSYNMDARAINELSA